MPESHAELFQQTGEDLVRLGLTTSHGGNLSIRHQGHMLITAHFAMAGRLEAGDIIRASLRAGADPPGIDLSRDTGLHRLIYAATEAMAVIHAHPPHAIALSLEHEVIRPRDLEGSYFLPEIPVVPPNAADARVPGLLGDHAAVMVAGHGSYAAGRNLGEALAYTSALELSARVIWLTARNG